MASWVSDAGQNVTRFGLSAIEGCCARLNHFAGNQFGGTGDATPIIARDGELNSGRQCRLVDCFIFTHHQGVIPVAEDDLVFFCGLSHL